MRVEIENTREVKEVVIAEDGTIKNVFHEYSGYVAKIVILNIKGNDNLPETEKTSMAKDISTVENDLKGTIDGLKYSWGQSKSRETTKEFIKVVSSFGVVSEREASWLFLNNGIRIRYANSVIYEGNAGDYLWYSFSFDELKKKSQSNKTFLALLIRESHKMVYLSLDSVIDDLEKAKKLRNNDWIHTNLIFTGGILELKIKTGKNNPSIIKKFDREKNYITWDDFIKNIIGGKSE
ncbi:MAG: hypothetical protein HZB92_03090 [Euryarchaeota archaeon]|nr:hypothetical protein [Euryarchaeota archaeon]